MTRRESVCMVVVALLAWLLSLNGCTASASRITDYLTGLQPLPADSQPGTLHVVAGLVVALPEDEFAKPTTPPQQMLERVAARVQKALRESPHLVIQRIFPPITIPAGGKGSLSLERLQGLAKEGNLTAMMVVVPTSQSARKLRFWPIMENQLYVRMDAALVEVTSGRVLMTEFGQDDYVMAESLDYVGRISYPRLYYRNFTFTGPFTVVDGDPQKALGEQAFNGAADQLGMKLRMRLSPEPPAG